MQVSFTTGTLLQQWLPVVRTADAAAGAQVHLHERDENGLRPTATVVIAEATYRLVEADQGKYVRVRVSFQDDDGNAETATSDATGPVSAEPNVAATGQPTISGTARVGGELTAGQRYQRRERTDDGELQLPVAACRHGERGGGGHLRSDERDLHGGGGGPGQVRASAVSFQDDDGNSETATSDATGPVSAEANVAATGQPTISGTAQVGEDLTAGTSGISDGNGLTTVSYSYQWTSPERECRRLVEADQGKYVRVRVASRRRSTRRGRCRRRRSELRTSGDLHR